MIEFFIAVIVWLIAIPLLFILVGQIFSALLEIIGFGPKHRGKIDEE